MVRVIASTCEDPQVHGLACIALPPLGLALAGDEGAVYLTSFEQRDQERADHAAVLHPLYRRLYPGRIALFDVSDPLDGPGLAVAGNLPGLLVLQPSPRAEVPAERASRAHLDERGQVVLPDADGVGRAGSDAHPTLDTSVRIDDRLLQVPEPDLPGCLVDIVHQLPDVEAGH